MGAPFFSNNSSDWTALEGVYINNLVPPAAILGVNLNGVGIAGKTIKGPINTPVLVSSPQRFVDVFGSRDMGTGGAVLNDVWLTMLNKQFGPQTYVVRAAAAAAVLATKNTSDGYMKIDASSKGVWGNSTSFQVANATDGNVNHFNLTVVDYAGKTTVYQNLDISTGVDNLSVKVGDDYANPVVLTKLLSGRPVNQGPTFLLSGADGTIADSDYTATDGPIDVGTNLQGIGVFLVANRSSATLKTKIQTNAGTVSDRLFLICPDTAATSLATAVTEVASYRSVRVVYCFNHPYTLDPIAALNIQVQPNDWMASILSQTNVSVNPASATDTNTLLQGISKLTIPAMKRADYISAKNAGIAALESQSTGFNFYSGCNTFLVDGTGRDQIDVTRETDFILLSLANALKPFVKQKASDARRAQMVSEMTGFLQSLQGTIIAEDSEDAGPGFLVDNSTLNTPISRGQGIEQILLKVRLLNDMDYIVLTASIGTQVTISAS